MSKINTNNFIFDNLEESGWSVFFYHYPYSKLPIRDIRIKTEPHLEIGADNFLRRCHQNNAIIPYLKSRSKYLFFSTVCKNPSSHRKIKQIVGYIEKSGFIKRDDERGSFYAVQGDTFFIPFKYAPTHMEVGLKNGRRFGKVDKQITQKILKYFHDRDNIYIQCVEALYNACKSSNYYRMVDSYGQCIALNDDDMTCDFLDDCLRWKLTKNDMTKWNDLIFKIEAKHHNFSKLTDYNHELDIMDLECNKCKFKSEISFMQLKNGFECPKCKEQIISKGNGNPRKGIEKQPNKNVFFRGIQIPQFEADVLQTIENQLGKQFELVKKIDYKTNIGFSIENHRITGIIINECGLRTLPESIGKLSSLKELHLPQNQLSTLPKSVGNLELLKKLNLNGNNLKFLPESITKLTSLQDLLLAENQIRKLPENIGNISSLKYLYLRDNMLMTLPESISNLKTLASLIVESNQISTLLESIVNLTSLYELNLSDNKLTTLPDSISSLTSLEILDLSQNYLTSLPESIKNLNYFEEFYLEDNPLDSKTKIILEQLKKMGIDIYY